MLLSTYVYISLLQTLVIGTPTVWEASEHTSELKVQICGHRQVKLPQQAVKVL